MRRLVLGTAGRAGRDVAVRVGARGAASALQAAALVLVARAAGPSDFGAFAIVLSFGYLASAITGIGASSRILRVTAELNGAALGDALLALRLFGSAVTLAACSVFLAFGTDLWIVVSAASLVASDQLIDYAQAYFAGHGRQLTSSLVVLIQRLIPFIGVGLLVLVESFAFLWLALLFVPVAVAVLVPLIVQARPPRGITTVIRSSIGYWAAGLASNLTQLEPIALSLVASSAVVGNYAIASRLTNPLTIVISALQTILVPELARRLGTASFQKVFRWFALASCAYALVLALGSGIIADVALWFLGNDYADGRSLITAMVVASGLSAVAQAYQAKLTAEARPEVGAWVIGGGVFLGLVVMLALVASFGAAVLWISPLFTHTVVTAGMIIAASSGGRRFQPRSASD